MYKRQFLKNAVTLSLASVIGLTTVLSPTAVNAMEKAESTKIIKPVEDNLHNNIIKSTSSLNIITQTEDILIYEIEIDGELLRYEEEIKESKDITEIITNIYTKGENGLLELNRSFETQIVTDKNQNTKIIQAGKTIDLVIPEIHVSPSPEVSNLAYTDWTTTRFPGMNLGYRKDYSKGIGQAKYHSTQRSNISMNSNEKWDTFVSDVNSLRSWEQALVFDATAVGLIEAILALGKDFTYAGALKAAKKFFVPVNTVYNAFQWCLAYNSATSSYAKLGGTKTSI